MGAINQSASRTLNGASQQDVIVSFRGQMGSFLVLATIICLSFAIRAYPLSHSGINWALDSDSTGYLRLADGIRAGCGFAARWRDGSCGPAELQRTPGYPLFLVSLRNLRLVVMAQAGLGAAVCMLVALFCWFQWGSAAGIIAASIAAFDLSSVISNNIGTEILFTFLVTMAILLLLILIQRAILDIWCIVGLFSVGCFLGATELVRPIGQVLLVIPFFSVVLATKSSLAKRVALLLLMLSIPVAVIAGWSYRNYEQRGCWVFSSIGAVNLYYYRAAGVLARETHRSVDEVKFDFLSSAGRALRGSDLWSQTFDEDPSEMRRHSIHILASHPLDVALMTFKAFAR